MPAGKEPPKARGRAAPPTQRNVNAYVGGRLRSRREQLGITLPELAKVVRMSIADLRDVETGQRELQAQDIYKLATLLEVPVAWFYDRLTTSAETDGGGLEEEAAPPPAAIGPSDERRARLATYFDALSDEAQEKLLDLARVMASRPKE